MVRLLFIFLLFFSSLSGYGQRKEYFEAVGKNTPTAYTNFLHKFPDSKFTEKALAMREKVCAERWKELRDDEYKRPRYFEKFIGECSDTPFIPMAKDSLAELEWRRTRNNPSSVGEFYEYLEKYPDTPHKNEALQRIEIQEWHAALNAGRKTAFDSFLRAFPESEYAAQAKEKIAFLEKYALPRASKAGNLEEVRQVIAAAEQDIKSEALMEAVWGLLHTGLQYKWNDQGTLDFFNGRTAEAPPETYLEIIQLLLKNGADPGRYAYADFASVEVKKGERQKKEEEFQKQVAEKGYGEMRTTIGGSELSGTYLDFGSGGLSIMEVAKLHQAEELIKLLKKR